MNLINVHIDISPSKEKRVCQNCKLFSKWGVHLGYCSKLKARITERLDWETCKKFERNDTNN